MNDKREPMKTEEERAKEYLYSFTNIVKGIQHSEHNYIIWNFIIYHFLVGILILMHSILGPSVHLN